MSIEAITNGVFYAHEGNKIASHCELEKVPRDMKRYLVKNPITQKGAPFPFCGKLSFSHFLSDALFPASVLSLA